MEKINTNHDSIPDQSETINQTVAANQKRGKKSLETFAKINAPEAETATINIRKAKKALYKLIATILAAGFVAGFGAGGALNEAKHNKAPLSEDVYRSRINGFLDQREAPSISFKESNKVEVTFSEPRKDGRVTYITLHDNNRDGKFEDGNATIKEGNVNGTAKIGESHASTAFNSENGLSIEESYNQLKSGLAKELASTGGK